MPTLDSCTRPFELSRRQVEIDRELTARFPELHRRKRARLLLSPHAFLRGSAPLFYEILAARPELASGPPGEGPIVGDMHLENMGAYKADDSKIVFDLNDFDDASIAPRRWDVLRLASSIILSARGLGARAKESIDHAERMIDHYVEHAFDSREPPPLPAPMLAIVEAAIRRSKRDLLDARAPSDHGRRRFMRGERYLDLSPAHAALAAALLPIYVRALGPRAPKGADSWHIEDAAQRVAGTGSLGRLRFAILVQDESGDERILDFKETSPSSIDRALSPAAARDPATRAGELIDNAFGLVDHPPKLLAPIRAPAHPTSFIGRQLTPQEDKLDVSRLGDRAALGPIAARAGFMLGRAHARGFERAKTAPWTAADCAALLDRAIEFAGIYEAIYLAYARIPDTSVLEQP